VELIQKKDLMFIGNLILMTNRQISELSHNDWLSYKSKNISKLRNSYPNFNFDVRFEIMKNVKDIVDEEGITLYLANGALLGAVRDKDFIKWDDDVDLDILAEEMIPKYDIIKNKLIDMGYIVRGITEFPKMKINVYHSGEKVGMLAIYLNGDMRHRGPYQWPKKIYDEYEDIDFRGVNFNTPKIKEYLIHQYGENWKIPLKENYFTKGLFK